MKASMRLLMFAACLGGSALPVAAMEARQAATVPAAPLQGVDVARDTLDSYVGTYVVGPGFEIRVWRQDQRLMLQATGQSAWPLVAQSESVFLVPAMEARISFGRDAQGRADHLTVYSQGQETRALRR